MIRKRAKPPGRVLLAGRAALLASYFIWPFLKGESYFFYYSYVLFSYSFDKYCDAASKGGTPTPAGWMLIMERYI
jgi:hypothetical protein